MAIIELKNYFFSLNFFDILLPRAVYFFWFQDLFSIRIDRIFYLTMNFFKPEIFFFNLCRHSFFAFLCFLILSNICPVNAQKSILPPGAQDLPKKNEIKTDPNPASETKLSSEPATSLTEKELEEIAEAFKFLTESKKELKDLKIYVLSGTDPATVSPDIAKTVLTTDPAAERLKPLAAKILDLHKLAEHCRVLTFENRLPMIFTYRLRSVSISTGLLNRLSDDEISALIGHELGHLYFGKELSDALAAESERAARIVELKCDLIALLTLRALKIDELALISALEKLVAARKEFDLTTLTNHSPGLAARRKLVETFSADHSPR